MEELQTALYSSGLKISSVEGKGRALVTTKRFSPGDLIIYQEPYASCPNRASSTSVCDGCFSLNNLRKCSACKVAWYCGNKCQKSEWKLHQEECKALSALPVDRKKKLTPTIRLMMRLLLKKKLQDENVIPTTMMDNSSLVDDLVSHMSELSEEQLVLYAQMANLVKLVLPSLDVNIKEITENFSKLACNAHTICDSELQSLGTGLYPAISMINHSCIPNSVLVFEGRVAFVRAVQPIEKDTEVSISYIETAASTEIRQNDLKKQYFFTCICPCCNKSPYEQLKENAVLEGYRCKYIKCKGFLLLDSEKKSYTCQQCGLGRNVEEIKMLKQEVERMLEKAKTTLSSGNLMEANIMYKKIEELQIKLYHPDSLNLLRTREALLKTQMELKDWEAALTYCKLTIPMYQKVYPETHPMLGLQYYTCGKLEWFLDHTEEALQSLAKAADVLKITHGTNAPFMQELYCKLEEARAEASYRRQSYNTDYMIED